jgi:tripartite-type tricarboxylate transporter receptor subunit TctC
VPYRGSSPLVAAMLAKDVDFGFDTAATSTAHIQSGAFRPLAVTTSTRASALPQVPTMQEAGLPGYDLGIWFNLAAARRTPPEAVARLREAVGKAMAPATVDRLRRAYVDPISVPAAENDAWIAASAERWKTIAREARIAAD